MGKKGLIISIVCSIVVVVALGVTSLVHVLKPKEELPPQNNGTQVNQTINEGNNKGSKEDPYYIYDAETFNKFLSLYGSKEKNLRVAVKVEKTDESGNIVKDENGNTVMTNKLDEFGHVVYEDVKDEKGNVLKEPYHFELYNDIDFTGVEYKTLFNDGTSFIGKINGKGFAVKNININVTTKNFGDYIFSKEGATTASYAHIGIFGDINNAVIENITFSNISVNVSDDVYVYASNDLWTDHKTTLEELTVGTIAACSENSTIKANVISSIDANSYGVYYEEKNTGRNFIGGVIGYAYNTTISNLDAGSISVVIKADGKGRNSYIGGVVGGLYSSTISVVDAKAEITSVSKSTFYIGGIAGYVHTSTIDNSRINLTVKQSESERAFQDSVYVNNKTLLEIYNGVGGVAGVVRANNAEEATTISNVKATSNVDMDCIFGGVVFRVNSADETKENTYVTMTNNTVSSTVKVLKAYGIGFIIPHTKVEYTPEYVYAIGKTKTEKDFEYNIMLVGEVLLANGESESGDTEYAAGVVSQNRANPSVSFTPNHIKLLTSVLINEKFAITDRMENIKRDFVG
ncbi:MAG: hypothetical protein IJX17_05510 [Clostridia bacterium]|nr:hypothetical protein [Clostridia bacterium]